MHIPTWNFEVLQDSISQLLQCSFRAGDAFFSNHLFYRLYISIFVGDIFVLKKKKRKEKNKNCSQTHFISMLVVFVYTFLWCFFLFVSFVFKQSFSVVEWCQRCFQIFVGQPKCCSIILPLKISEILWYIGIQLVFKIVHFNL